MLDLIKKVLGSTQTEVKAGTKAGAEAETENRETRIHVAACVVLLEAANVDYECTDDEVAHVLETMKKTFDLSHGYAEELMELAREEREKALDIWRFANRIKRNFSRAERLAIMEDIWRVIYADGRLDKHEDHFVRKLATLLGLSHREMIDTKLKVTESS
jgi:uncharacterized tellurite resistance protein B-like protein